MAKQWFRIAKEIKDEIINKLKPDDLSVADVAKQYGISDKTIVLCSGVILASSEKF